MIHRKLASHLERERERGGGKKRKWLAFFWVSVRAASNEEIRGENVENAFNIVGALRESYYKVNETSF